MKIIIPCCDKISYDGISPRFMTLKNGKPLIINIIESLNTNIENIIITIYKEHSFVCDILNKYFNNLTYCMLDYCKNQSDTIAQTIIKYQINESIFVKDCDSKFIINEINKNYNYICTTSLQNFDSINVNNKSYIQINHNNDIINMREKLVISDIFSAGGYYFTDSNLFLKFYNELSENSPSWQNTIYLSDVIGMMILNNHNFTINNVENYKDYGSLKEFNAN